MKARLLGWPRLVALALLCLLGLVETARAQMSPTGSHYAGRASDTGHSVAASGGGYATAVPLALPPARGGIAVPVAVTYGRRGAGAAGLGWDVPLSYVRRDATIARRRPARAAGANIQAREQIVVSLAGRTVQMVRDGSVWLARQDAPDLELRQEPNNTWRLLDGSGQQYVFTAPAGLVGSDLWLLTSVSSATAVNRVDLEYDVAWQFFPAGSGVEINLVSARYNTHPGTPGCTKNEIRFDYLGPVAEPLSIALLYDLPLVRMRTLAGIRVLARETCAASAIALRRYAFAYATDPDTKLPRLASVRMFGREGTPEASTSLPIASYGYGTATSDDKLRYERGTDIALPADLTGTPPIAATNHDPDEGSPGGGKTYVTWQNLLDVTGDGRPDLVYLKNGQLQVALNRPAGGSATSLGVTQQLSSPTLSTRPIASHASETLRYGYNFRSQDHVWRQTIDVNGDGRLDLIDATEEAGYWTVYLNTPGSPATWIKQRWNVAALRTQLEARGHVLDGDRVPLARRTTGFDLEMSKCFKWNDSTNRYEPYPAGFVLGRCNAEQGPIIDQRRWGHEKTFTEWEVRDINGDGYPDVVFNSSPITHVEGDPNEDPRPYEGDYHHFPVIDKLRPDGPNAVEVVFDVAGVRLEDGTNPFSAPLTLTDDTGDCGVTQWTDQCWEANGVTCGDDADRQAQVCGIEDVNGDGIADRIQGNVVHLGSGDSFENPSITIQLPDFVRQLNPQETTCANASSSTVIDPRQLSALRDLTGDGIPDFVQRDAHDKWWVWIGTGTRFNPPIEIEAPTPNGFAISSSREDCGGTFAQTMGGLYDIDGDGKPEVVHVQHLPSRLAVYHLAGATLGNPQAGRLSTIDNSHGAITSITYRSAKEDASTSHQVPFPEIVVTSVETTGTYGLGGALAAVRYAYGDAEMFFDPAADAFTMRAYGRSVEVHGTGREDWDADYAIVRETYRLPAFNPAMEDDERFARYQLAGRLRDTWLLGHDVPRDPWLLLGTFDPVLDARRMAGTHQEWGTRYVALQDPEVSLDCADVMDPFDWSQSFAANIDHSPCNARGFAYTRSTESWLGTQPPGSSASNVQTRVEVTGVDVHGNILAVRNENDRFRGDDDVCVDLTYAVPTTNTRIYSAVATRKVTNCVEGERNRVLSFDSFEYDGLPVASVSLGRATSHTVERHATDDGQLLRTIHEFEAGHDSVGNPNYMVSAREDGAVRAVQIGYDEFGLAPMQVIVDASGIAPLGTSYLRDPLSLALTAEHDANGTVWGTELDGFGREIRATVEPPGGSLGVVSTTSYAGFEGGATTGREIQTKSFRDPVAPGEVITAPGQESIAQLDELGRPRRVKQRLGADYGNESLVVLSRSYDGLGRVHFEADPYPASQDDATAYGTTYHFGTDGMLECSIRGNGPQAFDATPDLATERLPTCFSRVFTNHTVQLYVNTPDSLVGATSQTGVTRIDTMSAIGWLLSRETVRNSSRLERSLHTYDNLGQLVALTRFGAPASSQQPVEWRWRLDSSGQTLSSTEPGTATREYAYSDWGELTSVAWTDTTSQIDMRLTRAYDALGRLTQSVEWHDREAVPDTKHSFFYDTAPGTPLSDVRFTAGRLTQTTSSIGDLFLDYDAFGRVASRAYRDASGELYFQHTEQHFSGALAKLTFELSDTSYKDEGYKYEYDSAERLRTVMDSGLSGPSLPLYRADIIDPWGRVRSARYGQNTTFKAEHADTGRRLPRTIEVLLGKQRRRITFDAYDAVGRELDRTEIVDKDTSTITSRFDALGRIERATKTGAYNAAYTYDALGNLRRLVDVASGEQASLSLDTTDRDRLCRVDYGPPTTGPCNVSHDGSGNIIRQPLPGGALRVLDYYPSGAVRRIAQGSATATFRYDGSGEMSELDVSGPFLLDARRDRRYGLVERRDAYVKGALQSIIVRQIPGPGGIVASRRGDGGPWIFPFGEARGMRAASDDASFVQDVSYTPFGKATSQGVTPPRPEYTNYQWNGGDALADLGLVHLGARLYDPVIGRFLSRDPLIIPRTASSTNPYAFAFNDPTNFTDPSGLNPDPGQSNSACATSSGGPCGGTSPDDEGWYPGIGLVSLAFATADYLLGGSSSSETPAAPNLVRPSDVSPIGVGSTGGPGPSVGTEHLQMWPRFTPGPSAWSRIKDIGGRGLRVVGGAVAFGAGALLCKTGLGCVIGAPMMVAGADYAGAAVSGGPSAASYYGGPELQSAEDALVLTGGLISMWQMSGAGVGANIGTQTASVVTGERISLNSYEASVGGPGAAMVRATKAINLPSWRRIGIDMVHILERHTPGAIYSAGRTVFPSRMGRLQIERAVREAYRYGAKIGSQGDRIVIRGAADGLTIEMWVNKLSKIIETAYPVF